MAFSVENFLFDTPIYTKIEISKEDDYKEFLRLVSEKEPKDIEGYNPWRKVQTTFKISKYLNQSSIFFETTGGFAELNITCKRYGDVFRYYCQYTPSKNLFIKIGQYPSVADMHIGEIKKYSKLLKSEKLKEFTRAIGLAANGVGIGSFVYLRRIFEFLIFQAFENAKEAENINSDSFKKARMDQKIEMLREYLPDFLVEHKVMYSILSKGIHELDENICLDHFDTLRVGIEIILDEQLEELKKQEKLDRARKKLQDLKGKIS